MLATLDLVDTGARTHEDIFTGSSHSTSHGRVFGGQVLAQTVVAATRTVDAERVIHSMHAYFLRPGELETPITFSVDRIHDGRSFSTRRTQAYQSGLPILSMIASFQVEETGLDHQVEMPEGLPDPERLTPSIERLEGHEQKPLSWAKAFDLRHVDHPVYVEVRGARRASQAVWMRTIGPLPDDPRLHRAAMAYASDLSLLESVFRRHGVAIADEGVRVVSLDHAMWWHRPGRADEWMLYVQDSPSATSGRGLALGRLFSRDGTLLATVAQEGMIRVPGSLRA